MPYVGKSPADIIATAVDTTTGTFSGDLTVDTNTLFVDSANNNVGIGLSSNIDRKLHVEVNNTYAAKFGGTAGGDFAIEIGQTGTNGSAGFNATGTGGAMKFSISGSEAMRIDSSGNLGIGTSSPAAGLHIDNPNNSAITAILDTDNSAVKIVFRNNTETGNNVQIGADGSNLVALTNGSERMRIDSSGNVLVGVSSVQTQGGTTAGTSLYGGSNAGLITAGRNGDILRLNRHSTDGDIAVFRKDGTTVGSIGANGGQPYFSNGGNFAIRLDNNTLTPANPNGTASDYAENLGSSSARWADLYLGGGVYLGGTGSANYLQDYEEGTWTPQAGSESGAFTAGYSNQSGKYTKVGNRVWATFDIQLTSRTLSGSIAFLYGLPFAVRNNGDLSGSFGNIATTNNKGANFYQISIYAQNNASYCYLTATQSNTAELGTIANSFWGASTRLAGGIIYNTV